MGISSGLSNNPLVAQPLPLLSTFSLCYYSFHYKIPFCLILLQTSTSGFEWIRIWLLHHLPLWHASGGPSHLPFLLGKILSQQSIFPKETLVGVGGGFLRVAMCLWRCDFARPGFVLGRSTRNSTLGCIDQWLPVYF